MLTVEALVTERAPEHLDVLSAVCPEVGTGFNGAFVGYRSDVPTLFLPCSYLGSHLKFCGSFVFLPFLPIPHICIHRVGR